MFRHSSGLTVWNRFNPVIIRIPLPLTPELAFAYSATPSWTLVITSASAKPVHSLAQPGTPSCHSNNHQTNLDTRLINPTHIERLCKYFVDFLFCFHESYFLPNYCFHFILNKFCLFFLAHIEFHIISSSADNR